MVVLSSGSIMAGEKLGMPFIQGGGAALNSAYAPGRYLVDLPQ